jgi:hypothetical protein
MEAARDIAIARLKLHRPSPERTARGRIANGKLRPAIYLARTRARARGFRRADH